MGKMEIEVKILNIDVAAVRKRILESGGIELGVINQKLYTYDMPTIRGRFLEILQNLNSSKHSDIDVFLVKMRNLLFEIENIEADELNDIYDSLKITKLQEILDKENYMDYLNSKKLLEYVKKLSINPNKWVRLRDSNGKVTLAIKHILLSDASAIQQLMETEIEVTGFEETNEFLLQLGFVHKSYQEKKRIKYCLSNHEIDMDFWPGIPAFIELEGSSEKDIENVLNIIGYTLADTVSCTADEIYRMNGKDMFANRELRFDEAP